MLMRSSEFRKIASSENILLRRLSRSDQDLLHPYLEEVGMARGDVVIRPDDPLDAVYFIDSGMVSIEERIGRRGHIEIAVVGREGLLGWPSLLGCERSCHSAVVQGGCGSALKIGLQDFRRVCLDSPTLWVMLLAFVQTIILQMGRTIASHLDHSLDQNLARWLLMRHDRTSGDELLIRHDEIGDALGVRRASITDKMHILEGKRLVRCNRGKLVVRNRTGLERAAGEAYGQAEAHYRQLVAPFGKSPIGSGEGALPKADSEITPLVQDRASRTQSRSAFDMPEPVS